MRAILINPFDGTVTETEYSGELKDIYRLTQCGIVEVARADIGTHTLYVDEEGLFKKDQKFFAIDGARQPYAGRGLIVGYDNGDDSAATISLDEVKDKVRFQP